LHEEHHHHHEEHHHHHNHEADDRRLGGHEESAVIGSGDQNQADEDVQPALQYGLDAGGFSDVGQAELNKTELLESYR